MRCKQTFSEWIIARTDGQTMLYLTRSMVASVDLARYGMSRAKDLGILVLQSILYTFVSNFVLMNTSYIK